MGLGLSAHAVPRVLEQVLSCRSVSESSLAGESVKPDATLGLKVLQAGHAASTGEVMGLRSKLALLLGVFCLFMIGSVLSAAWCIAVYLDSAVSDFRRAEFLTFALEDIRTEVRAHVLDATSKCALGREIGSEDNVPTRILRISGAAECRA